MKTVISSLHCVSAPPKVHLYLQRPHNFDIYFPLLCRTATTMSNFLKSTTDFVGNTAQQGAKGLQSADKFVGDTALQGAQGLGKGVNSGVNAVTGAFTPAAEDKQQGEPKPAAKSDADTKSSSDKPASSSAVPESQSGSDSGPIGGLVGGLSSGLQTGAGFLGDVTKSGLSIGGNIAQTGVDMTGNVVMSAAGLAGTAIGGVVTAAAEASGKAFEPVAAGLRSIEGLEGLADNLEKMNGQINGLPMAAIKQVGSWTFQAINLSGKTPTFFDRDGDGIVQVQDTITGLIVLGLSEKSATYGAYVLHGVFSYSTSESWIPSKDTALPIHVDKMGDTRWGKNWGSFDRMEWCSDMDVETFFETADEDTPTLEKWKQTLTKGRQGFGVLMLILCQFLNSPTDGLCPDLPVADIPFKDDIAKVVRTNWQMSHGIEPNKDSEPISKKKEEEARRLG
ncbi:hypothetical protein C8R46DRAFT_1059291 [Mycena filopes]|nr:hypothetical protein C8R46DRAFT_1059291 [Mycena filopes]